MCHRSFAPRSIKDRKRSLKHCGSAKVGHACPSAIILTHLEQEIKIIYYPLHLGHDCDIFKII